MWSYTYSGYLWPSLLTALFIAALAVYGFQRRRMRAALPFAVACLFGFAWAVGSMLGELATGFEAKAAWLQFTTVWQLPVVAAATFFVLQYAGWDRWLTRRTTLLLAVPPLLAAVLIATDPLHHLFWSDRVWTGSEVLSTLGPAGLAALGYSYLLSLLNIGLLLWVLVRSPARRWPVALMVLGQVGARAFFEWGVLRLGFPRGWDPDPFVLVVVFGLYATATFRFHVFDPVPAARSAAIDQMLNGMLVVDLGGRIVEANPAAEKTLGDPVARLRGRVAGELLPALGALEAGRAADGAAEMELELRSDGSARHYRMEVTPLRDRGEDLGSLLLLHDVTEQRAVQARVLEQERVVATLEERERLARELHDSVGQVLGYVSLQTQTIQKWLDDGDGERAHELLGRLAHVAQDAHTDLRESILALRAASSDDWAFLPALSRYLADLRAQYGIDTQLLVAEGVSEETFSPKVAVQLLRVIQEALTNARRHGGACEVQVTLDHHEDHVRVTMTDDGCGFDIASLPGDHRGHFGLAFMRERMEKIGGTVTIDSRPGGGTRVQLDAPVAAGQEGRR